MRLIWLQSNRMTSTGLLLNLMQIKNLEAIPFPLDDNERVDSECAARSNDD